MFAVLSAYAATALALLITVQHDEHNELLINNYHGLAAVVLMLITYSISVIIVLMLSRESDRAVKGARYYA